VSGTGLGSGHQIRFKTPDPIPITGSGHRIRIHLKKIFIMSPLYRYFSHILVAAITHTCLTPAQYP